MRKWMLPVVTAAVVAIAFVSYTSAGDKGKHQDKGTASVAIGQPAPQFSLPDQTGKTVSLADFSGKIVVLEWFNEGCPIVVGHYKAGTMNTLYAKYAPKDVVWLAINSTKGNTNDSNKAAAADWKMDRPILNDSNGQIGHVYGARTTPHMFIVNTDGVLVYMGAIDDKGKVNYVDKALGELLSGNSVSEPQTKPYGCSVKYAN